MSHKIILCELREGRQSTAIEALESSIDAQVCIIWRGLRNADPSTKHIGLDAPKVIQEYRKKYPRTPIPGDLPRDLAEISDSMRKQAAEILSNKFESGVDP